jgi:hypothetical protein
MRVRGECVEIDGRYFLGGEQEGEDQRLVELRGRQLEQATIETAVVRTIDVQDDQGRVRKANVYPFRADLPFARGEHKGYLFTAVIR